MCPRRVARRGVVTLVVLVALGAVLLVGAGLVTVRVLDGRDRVEVGDEVDAAFVPRSTPVTVRVPPGTLQVVVGDPVDEVDGVDGVDVGTRAPRGGSLVGVSVTMTPDPRALYGPSDAAPAEPELQLRIGDARYPVSLASAFVQPGGTAVAATRSAYVAVDGRPDLDRSTLVVTFDGVAQTVDLASGTVDRGRAAGLYDTAATRPQDVACPDATWSTGFRGEPGSATRCGVAVLGVPWVTTLGWAPVDRDWVVVLGTQPGFTSVTSREDDPGSHAAQASGTAAYALDGADPVATFPRSIDPADGEVVVFAPTDAPGALRITRTYTTTDTSGLTAQATWRVRLASATAGRSR
ncbi:hypothetical protein [Nocardioides rubriscoriae]|uniref:hypothetical protein n=1 Tax=Nocardioides rubriscoriae TaxID=642762 RepID=UPI0011DFAE07|nr:hypothetical protein [Nocardioides rubriscoriae]